MTPFDMRVQLPNRRKWFSANVTIVFFATIMNSFYMLVQISWCVKWIITEITFEIFASLMNSLDMFVLRQEISYHKYYIWIHFVFHGLPRSVSSDLLYQSTTVSEKDFPQKAHCWSYLLFSWMHLMWLFRSFTRKNGFPQVSHLWFLWTSWVFLMCILSLWDLENDFPQKLHL